MYADITGRKKAIDYYLKEVQSHIEDAVLSLLTQASAALTSVSHRATQEEEGLGSFELKEKFAPMQKKTNTVAIVENCKRPREKTPVQPHEVARVLSLW